MDNPTRVWDQQPNETAKAFAAFVTYRELPPYGNPSRSIDRAKIALGLSAASSTLNDWSSKYNWIERVRAYDSHMANSTITLKEVAQEEYARSTMVATSARVVGLGRIVEKMMVKMEKDLDSGVEIAAGDVKRLTDMVKTIDDLSRRMAGLPTTYLTAVSEVAPDEEEAIYVIGAGKSEPMVQLESGDDGE